MKYDNCSWYEDKEFERNLIHEIAITGFKVKVYTICSYNLNK